MAANGPRKGLNVPQQARQTALDVVFAKVEEFLRLDESSPLTALQQMSSTTTTTDPLVGIQVLMDRCFDYIDTIQSLSLAKAQEQQADPERANLLTISLHDLKFFNALTNVIIVQCIYPLLPAGVGIPLDQRRLKSFMKRDKLFKYQRVQGDLYPLMTRCIQRFEKILERGGEVVELLMKGSGLTDVLTLLMVLTIECSESYKPTYARLEQKADTYTLYGIYTSLLQSTTRQKYKAFISSQLGGITINRANGILSLIDFIVGIREDQEVNIEKFHQVNRVLMSKPQGIPSTEYWSKLFKQLLEILVFVNRPVLLSVCNNFLRVVYQKNRRIVQDFLFKPLVKVWVPDLTGKPGDTLISEKELNDSTNVLISLTKESDPELLDDLFSRIILGVWSYYFYLRQNKLEYSSIVNNILVSFLSITEKKEFLETIILNLINSHGDGWAFFTTLENKLTCIQRLSPLDAPSHYEIMQDIDVGMETIVELLKNLGHDTIREQFLIVLDRWIRRQGARQLEENPFILLIDLKFLETINEKFKDVLLEKPEQVLNVVKSLLKVHIDLGDDEDVDSDDEEEEEGGDVGPGDHMSIVLELLSAIISETPPDVLKQHEETLKEVQAALGDTDKHRLSLNHRIDEVLQGDFTPLDTDPLAMDRELFQRAITNMNDPLVPIRAHGLHMLRQLIAKRSPVLSLDFVLELHIVQLQDSEPFIYLNVIKSLSELIEFDTRGTVEFLIKAYINKREKLDDRLKIGEVLDHFISREGELLQGALVESLIGATLSVVRDFDEDDKLRMSAMSLLGESLRTNALGLDNFIQDSLDCVIGIMDMEKQDIMKRSAVVLVADLLAFGGLEIIPRGYGPKLLRTLEYERNRATDYLLLEQIDKVKTIVEELMREKFVGDQGEQFKAMRI